MKGKKGFSEAMFHWIFILIAGALILSFFISVVIKQRSVSETKVAIAVVQDLETITTGAGVSTGTAQLLDKPDFDLYFNCDYCICKYEMQSKGKILGSDDIIFSSSKIIGKNIIAWTKDWNAPFRITNFLFLTSPYTGYYFIYDDMSSQSVGLMRYINKSLPSKISVKFYAWSEIPAPTFEDLNFPEVKLIYLNMPIDSMDAGRFSNWRIEDYHVTAVVVEASNPFEYGQLSFYKKNTNLFVPDRGIDNSGYARVDFYGDESIFAAIFAQNYDIYTCNMKKAMSKMNLVSYIYDNRTSQLYFSECISIYNSARKVLRSLMYKSGNISKDIGHPFTNYSTTMNYLEDFNHELVINGCTPIY